MHALLCSPGHGLLFLSIFNWFLFLVHSTLLLFPGHCLTYACSLHSWFQFLSEFISQAAWPFWSNVLNTTFLPSIKDSNLGLPKSNFLSYPPCPRYVTVFSVAQIRNSPLWLLPSHPSPLMCTHLAWQLLPYLSCHFLLFHFSTWFFRIFLASDSCPYFPQIHLPHSTSSHSPIVTPLQSHRLPQELVRHFLPSWFHSCFYFSHLCPR